MGPIFSCKIWQGQENNGMTIKMSCGIAASSQNKRTVIEAVHVLDRQEVSRWRQENGRTHIRHEVLRAMNGLGN